MPNIAESEYFFTSSEGKTPIHVREWTPDCDLNGVVQISHGINEYIGRYEHFARYLASKGFVVVGNDHLGHADERRGGRAVHAGSVARHPREDSREHHAGAQAVQQCFQGEGALA